ncbi:MULTISPECIES: LamG-like jellyroll fold domain-containing protein [Paenibacillus]|uniref:LamG-like jellyroll fold domain-containing protein n=1 Tax=Paenibacillus TaxID=44249 RepID=UPI0022B8B72E|nr:LamG-like jellyroll fold domain-containing protein [Paenibacillus caseinilyticus]MCZ8518529.1 family 43 glycosylhydrolase [Paenibacillus caseinilyticus]
MKKRWTRRLTIATLALVCLMPNTVLGQSADTAGQYESNSNKPGQDHQKLAPVFQNVSVHDPSIVKDGKTFYVFGSHIEAAKSTDLMSWTRFTNGYTTPGNVIFGDLSKNLAGSFAWAGENDSDSLNGFSVWAPDVFWNPDYQNADGTKGAYMMYYCTSSTYKRSAIGYGVSQKIEGPYTYVDTIMYSGFTSMDAYDKNSKINTKYTNTNLGQLIDQGVLAGPRSDWFTGTGDFNTSENGGFPNAIDPALFHDKEGKLWMAYGSWSGGIFVLQIDKKTGKAIYPGKDGKTKNGNTVDRYFGTKIAGGYGKSGEGPYVTYNKQTGYFYLYDTYGWLGADGGYNMRVFRSKNPDGPYVDGQGQNAVLPGDTDHAPYGNKLMGNFLFERKVGDPGTGIGTGYTSPGHNSVFQDPKTGQQFLVFHSRFPKTGEVHELRVHQMFMNEHDWPVVAPYRYGGEELEKVNRQDLIGEYQFINHGKETTGAIKTQQYIRLNKNNTITGDIQGTWEKTDQNEIKLTVDGSKYDGVFVRLWDPTSARYVMTFTAVSQAGVSVWGSQLPDRTDADVVSDVYQDLNLGDTDKVIANLNLPTEGSRHTKIVWQTSDAGVVSAAGEVHRPESGSANATATLTATVTKGGVTKTKSFAITVLPYKDALLTAQYGFEDNLADGTGHFGVGTITGNRLDNTGGTVTYTPGKSGQAAVLNGASGVRLPNGLISSNAYSVSLWLKPEQLTSFTTTFFGGRDANNWVSLVPSGPAANNTMVWSGSTTWYDAPAGMTIPAGEWSHVAFTVDNGTITLYVNGVQKFTGSNFPNVFTSKDAAFGLGVNWWDTPFKGAVDELRVYEGALSPSQLNSLASNTP